LAASSIPAPTVFDLTGPLEDGRVYARPTQRDGRRETAYAGTYDHRSHP